MGGIAFRAPVLATLFLIVAFATLAMPGSSNFVGEFMILLGVFQAKLAISVIAFAGVVGAAVYALRLFIGAMHNRVGPQVTVARDRARRRRRRSCRSSRVILVLAFYPAVRAASAPSRRLQAHGRRAATGGSAPHAVRSRRSRSRMIALAAAHLTGPHIDWAALVAVHRASRSAA